MSMRQANVRSNQNDIRCCLATSRSPPPLITTLHLFAYKITYNLRSHSSDKPDFDFQEAHLRRGSRGPTYLWQYIIKSLKQANNAHLHRGDTGCGARVGRESWERRFFALACPD